MGILLQPGHVFLCPFWTRPGHQFVGSPEGWWELLCREATTVPSTRYQIEELPGVGQYIANAIELIRFGIARPLLDVNMARVLERYFGPRELADIRFDPYLTSLAQAVVDCETPLLLSWAILDLGATVCTSRAPRCASCLLASECNYAKGISCAKGEIGVADAGGRKQ